MAEVAERARAGARDCDDKVHDFLNRPLGGFALMGAWVGLVQVFCCIYSLRGQRHLAECRFPEGFPEKVGIINWLWIQTGSGAMDMLFAPYVHIMLFRHLLRETREADVPGQPASDRTLQARTADGPIRASRHDILEAFKETFRADPVVYLYMLGLVAAFAWSIMGCVWISAGGDGCTVAETWSLKEAYVGIFFFGFVLLYSAAWYYEMQYMDQDEVLTLRSPPGSEPEERGFHKPPPPPAAEDNSSQGLLHSWFHGSNANTAQCSHSNAGNNAGTANNQEKPKKGKCRLAVKLLFSMFLDMLGNATYVFPTVGEVGDAVFAPASAVMLKMLYNRNGVAGIGFLEEILPFTDITPTATLAFFMENVMGNNCLTRCFGFHKD